MTTERALDIITDFRIHATDDDVREAMQIAKEALTWIPVSERLPRYNQNVMTFAQNMAMPIVVDWYNGYYGEDDEEWYEGWNTGRKVTHWKPLPQPPKEEQ